MKCQRCKKEFEEREIQQHHLHPRFMDNEKGNGMKIYLCKKCHNILHLIIPKIIFKRTSDKIGAIKDVINFTKRCIDDN
ncbi:MAG TPA: hypothetical protein VMZ91_07085 [Candidatus Paceibacterota bacterium]|nr:hypothetical protein [Candidatus Paceibacterota bacterium]